VAFSRPNLPWRWFTLTVPFQHRLPIRANRSRKRIWLFCRRFFPCRLARTVEFPNLDDTYHNIFSYSPAKRFDLGRYRPEERPIPSVLFDVPGLVTLRCDIHEHMRGLILVLNTPYFVITDEAGRFRLSGLPPGRYTLKAWIDSKTTREQPVELKSGATLHTDFP